MTQKVVASFVKSLITFRNSSLLRKVLFITNRVLLLNVTSHLSMKVNLLITSLDLNMLHKHNISIDNKFDYFYETLSDLVDKDVPSKKITRKDIKLHSKPWITSKIVRLIWYRDRLRKKLKRKFTPDIEFLYKKFRNRVVSELRTSRAAYYNQYFLTHKDNMKKLWSGIRSIINIKHKTTLNISQLVMDGIAVTDPKHIASAFNRYFVNVPQQVDKATPRTKKSPIDYLKDRNGHTILLTATDPLEIETIIMFFNNSKSVGPYSISMRLL